MSDSSSPSRLDRIEAIVESNAMAIRDFQINQDRTQQQFDQFSDRQDRTQQQLDQFSDRQDRTQQQLDQFSDRQDRTQQQLDQLSDRQDRTQQQLDQLGLFVADISNDLARLAQNADRAELERVQLTADIRSLVNALQNRFAGNGQGSE